MTLEVVGMQKMLLNNKHNAGRHPTAESVSRYVLRRNVFFLIKLPDIDTLLLE